MASSSKSSPLSDILSKMEQDSSFRTECLMPLDDDWKERMRAISQNNEGDSKERLPPPEET